MFRTGRVGRLAILPRVGGGDRCTCGLAENMCGVARPTLEHTLTYNTSIQSSRPRRTPDLGHTPKLLRSAIDGGVDWSKPARERLRG